jgi:CHAT domain-containing protein
MREAVHATWLYPAFAALLACGAGKAVAEEICVDSRQTALERAVHWHFQSYESLAQARGVSTLLPADPGDVDGAALEAFFAANLRDLRSKAGGEPVVLFYAQDDRRLCAFLISATEPPLYEWMDIAADGLSHIQDDWRRSLAIERLTASRAPRLRAAESTFADEPAPSRIDAAAEAEARSALSRILLPPSFAAAIPRDAELIVVPTSDIGTVPFALLEVDDDERLVDRAAVTIAPNLLDALLVNEDVFAQVASRETDGPLESRFARWENTAVLGVAPGWSNAVLIGDPDATGDPDWVFPRLSGARREVEQIASLLASDGVSGPPAKLLFGRQATRDAVLDSMTSEPSLLYFAAHGIADVDEPLDGFIALAGGRLTARDVQNLKTGAGLVVLSACQTGLGKAHAGGIIGLARGFQLSGAVAVVMSLWSVDDDATRLLMTEFMRRVGTMSPSQALREAMLALRKTHDDPLLWGSFQVFGRLMPAAR